MPLNRKEKPRGLHRHEILTLLAHEQNFICGICHKGMGEMEMCNIDHIIPLGSGGTGAWSNLQATHIACNNAKGDRILTSSPEDDENR